MSPITLTSRGWPEAGCHGLSLPSQQEAHAEASVFSGNQHLTVVTRQPRPASGSAVRDGGGGGLSVQTVLARPLGLAAPGQEGPSQRGGPWWSRTSSPLPGSPCAAATGPGAGMALDLEG